METNRGVGGLWEWNWGVLRGGSRREGREWRPSIDAVGSWGAIPREAERGLREVVGGPGAAGAVAEGRAVAELGGYLAEVGSLGDW